MHTILYIYIIYFSKTSPFCQTFRLFIMRGSFKRSVTSSKCLMKGPAPSHTTVSNAVLEVTHRLCIHHFVTR